jgi:hypothetical protein
MYQLIFALFETLEEKFSGLLGICKGGLFAAATARERQGHKYNRFTKH